MVVPRLPVPGETVIGTTHFSSPGGKGANQAVAAARLGATVALLGAVGDDDAGAELLAGLEAEGVDLQGMKTDATLPSGAAFITVDSEAENTIVVSPGANSGVDASGVESHRSLIETARVVLAQLEVPLEAVVKAAQLARGMFILNAAPARDLPASLLEMVDVLIVNESELAFLAKQSRESQEDLVQRASELHPRVVVTQGAAGAALVQDGRLSHVSTAAVTAVDPTGAGDTFCGALATRLAAGQPMLDSMRFAAAAGAAAVTNHGAQTAMPSVAQVEALLAG